MKTEDYLERLERLGFCGLYLERAKRLAGQPPLLAVYKILQLAVEKKNMLPDEALALVENALGRVEQVHTAQQGSLGSAPQESPVQENSPGAEHEDAPNHTPDAMPHQTGDDAHGTEPRNAQQDGYPGDALSPSSSLPESTAPRLPPDSGSAESFHREVNLTRASAPNRPSAHKNEADSH